MCFFVDWKADQIKTTNISDNNNNSGWCSCGTRQCTVKQNENGGDRGRNSEPENKRRKERERDMCKRDVKIENAT